MEHLPIEVIDSLARSRPNPLLLMIAVCLTCGFLMHFA